MTNQSLRRGSRRSPALTYVCGMANLALASGERVADRVRILRKANMRRVVSLAVAVLLIVGGPLSTRAESHYLCIAWPYSPGYLLTLPHWNEVNISTYSEYGDAIYDWNTAGTAAYFTYGYQYNWKVHSVNTNYGATTWAGYAILHSSPPWCGGATTDASVLLNDYWLTSCCGQPGYGYNDRRHVEGQELGHALTLDHAPGYASVMGDYAYWYVQQHDKDDMYARYRYP